MELSTERLDYMLFTKTYRDYCKPLTDYYIRSKLAGVPEEEVFSSPEFVFLSTKYTDSLINYYSVIARYAGMDATPVTTREELITRLSDPALQPLGEQASRAIWVLKHSLARGDTFPGGTEFPSDTSSILVVDALRAQCSPFGYLNLFDNYEKTVENPRKSEFSQLSTIKALREDRIKCVIDHYPDAVRYAQFTDDKMPTEAKDLRIKLEHTLDIAGTKYHGSGLFELRDLWVTVLEQTWANEAADDLKQFGPTRE